MNGKPMAIRSRLGTLLASIALAASLAPTVALADPTSPTDVADSKVTITDLVDGDVVSAYQIADADIDAGNNLTYNMASNLPADYNEIGKFGAIASDGTDFVQNSAIQKAASAVAKSFSDANVAAKATATAANKSAELTLGSGYYLIRVTSTSGTARVYQNMIIDVSPVVNNGKYEPHADQSLAVKKTDVGLTKTVVNEQNKKTDGYSVGDSVPFTIKTAIPSYPADSKDATFVITDTPTKGLEIEPASIKINGAPAQSGADYTITAAATGYTITFSKDYVLSRYGMLIEVSYTAKVTSDAFSKAGSVTGNTAKVTFNPNPYTSETAEPSDTTEVKTYGYVFKKVNPQGQPLPGATFTLTLANGQVLTSTSDKDGYVYFSGLAAGSYTVTETGVPAGYQKVTPDPKFELNEGVCKGDNPATTDVEDNYLVATADGVVDPIQAALPAAGGPGTLIITAAGVILLAVGGFVLVRTQGKKNAE